MSDQLDQQGQDRDATAAKATRMRFGKLPKPLPGGLPYAKSNPLLQDFDEAAITAALLGSQAWKDVMGDPSNPADGKPLNRLDAERTKRGKQKPLYTAHELEAVLVYQRVCGLRSYREARDRLTSDRGQRARQLLGFNRPRNVRFRKVMTLRDGVPSEATVSRHRLRFAAPRDYDSLANKQRASFTRRAALWRRLERRLLAEHSADADFREEARLLHLDGSALITHYTPPEVKPDSEDMSWNDKAGRKVTAPDAGYMSKQASITRVGPGWNLLTVTTQTGVPVAWKLTPINASEKLSGKALVERELRRALRELDRNSEDIRVLVADSGFSTPHIRRALRRVGVLENIHHVSHAKSDRSTKNAKGKAAARYGIEDSPGRFFENWYATGHRELKCVCGNGVVAKRVTRGANGHLVSKLEGQCDTCGPISIRSGTFHVRRNGDKNKNLLPERRRYFSRVDQSTDLDGADFLFGNPLTFSDPVAQEYGRGRWSYNEGFYGQLVSRFQLLKGKRWIRFGAQAKLETSMTFALMHAITLEERARQRGRSWAASGAGLVQALAPPGIAAAA